MEDQRGEDHLSSWVLGNSIVIQMSLRAAIELDIFNIIANAGSEAQLSAAEIVEKIPTTNPSAAITLDRILRLLSVNSLLSMSQRPCQSGDDATHQEMCYGLTQLTRHLATNKDGVSSASTVLFLSERMMVEPLYMLKNMVLEPECKPFYSTYGANFYEHMAKEPRFDKQFQEFMTHSAKLFLDKVLQVYRGFEEVKELLDVGGGMGTSLGNIISMYPHIHGKNFDLPNVISVAPKLSGVEHISGNMFESLPRAEAILLKWILHNWDDEHCKKLLKNCWEALPIHGKVIALETLIPQALGNDFTSVNTIIDDFYMMLFHEGKVRTLAEFETLGKAVGFAETKIFAIGQGINVIEFLKN
nr:(S)-scoulerine 9-O-methyltransferase-like [Quercus suber]